MTANRLADAQSPYLHQHKDNPVHWQPWDDAAFALARASDKPVLLSIGYSSCHWCHVMAHESFEHPDTAAVMNTLFVNIKVDREERPDLDRLFLSALQRMGKTSGWPATVFLTPRGQPFAGGGYFPRDAAFGLPAFRDVLRDVAAQYHADPSRAAASGHDVIAAITTRYRRSAGGTIETSLLDKVAHDLARQIDWLYGGFGQVAPKFLHAGGHEIVLRAWRRTGEPELLEQVAGSMRAICDGGCYDHLGGGFHRYATDDQWHVPHFEKMLHDNALMISLLTKFFQATRDPVFADRVAETVEWLGREMRLPDGAYATSLDADSEAGEGAFYTWPPSELRDALGPDAGLDATYALTDSRAFEGRCVIVRKAAGPRPAVMDRLRVHRDARGLPARDDKVLADWNGLTITALAEAGLAFGRDDWIAAAAQAFNAVLARLAGPGTLAHSALAGRGTIGFADDYACMAQAALALFEATGDDAFCVHAKTFETALDTRFWDEADGGYFFTEADADAHAARQKLIDETTMPTANGTMLGVLARLGFLTGEDRYFRRAEGIVRCFADRLSRGSISVATALNNAQAPANLVQVVVVGDAKDARPLLHAAANCFVPDRLLLHITPGAELPDGHPAHGKGLVSGAAAAYVCVGKLCLSPVTTQTALSEALASRE